MKETDGKKQIDLAAMAFLRHNYGLADSIVHALVDYTIANGRLSEELHRNDLLKMASDCAFLAAKKISADAGSELVIGFPFEDNDAFKADLDRLGIRHENSKMRGEQ